MCYHSKTYGIQNKRHLELIFMEVRQLILYSVEGMLYPDLIFSRDGTSTENWKKYLEFYIIRFLFRFLFWTWNLRRRKDLLHFFFAKWTNGQRTFGPLWASVILGMGNCKWAISQLWHASMRSQIGHGYITSEEHSLVKLRKVIRVWLIALGLWSGGSSLVRWVLLQKIESAVKQPTRLGQVGVRHVWINLVIQNTTRDHWKKKKKH